mgnify:CR=1 FL=1
MKPILLFVFCLVIVSQSFSQISEYDTLGVYQYTTTYEKAEYIKDSDFVGHWEFTFRHADGDLFTFKQHTSRFANNLLLNKGLKNGDDTPINIGKKFLVVYCDLDEFVWYDEEDYYWDPTYEYDSKFNYYSGISAEFAE